MLIMLIFHKSLLEQAYDMLDVSFTDKAPMKFVHYCMVCKENQIASVLHLKEMEVR